MLKYPPMFPTNMTPTDVIGRNNVPLFRKFYEIAHAASNDGEWPEAKLRKEFCQEDRSAIAATLVRLRENGFCPGDILPNGKIAWAVVTKSECQTIMEKGLKLLNGIPEGKLKDMARKGWCPLIERVKVEELSEVEEAAYNAF